jgi:carboxypeptidase Q
MARKIFVAGSVVLLVTLLALAQQPERVDLNAVHKIKTAELGRTGVAPNSKAMEIVYNLTDRYGPRLTNSPQFRAAGNWAVGQLKEWGLSNVHL